MGRVTINTEITKNGRIVTLSIPLKMTIQTVFETADYSYSSKAELDELISVFKFAGTLGGRFVSLKQEFKNVIITFEFKQKIQSDRFVEEFLTIMP